MRNLPAAISARLKARARALGMTPESVYSRWVMEGFLRRLSQSNYKDRFCLKGALLFAAWEGNWFRTTMDVDLDGLDVEMAPGISEVIAAIAKTQICEPDGVAYDLTSMRRREISGSSPAGSRVIVNCILDAKVLPLKIDVAFGHPITPGPEQISYPSLLEGFSDIPLLAVPRETMLADKVATIVEFGRDNTRIRDYWDIAALADRSEFDSEVMIRAIRRELGRRHSIDFLRRTDGYWEAGLSTGFACGHPHESVRIWGRRQPRAGGRDVSFDAVLGRVGEFSRPLLKAARRKQKSIGIWRPESGWMKREQAPEL